MIVSEAIALVLDRLEEPKQYRHEIVSKCPFCGSDKKKFYLNTITGQYDCKRGSCGAKGNLTTLFKHFGIGEVIEYEDTDYVPKHKKAPFTFDMETLRKLEDSDTDIIDYMMSRGITYETLLHAGVMYSLRKRTMTFLTYVDCQLKGVVYRTTDKKIFMESGSEQCLWLFDMLDYTNTRVYITEGHIDALTLLEMGIENVVSMPNGVLSQEWIQTHWDSLNRFKEIVLCYDNDDAGRKGLVEARSRLDFATLYELEYGDYNDINEMYMNDCEALYATVRNPKVIDMDGFVSLQNVSTSKNILEELSSCGLTQFDRIFGGFGLGQSTIICSSSGSGKAVPNNTNVFVSNGTKKISELVVGDKIFGEDGQLHDVLGIYPQGKKEVVEIVFSDGTKSKCCEDHLWTTLNKRNKERTIKTSEIRIGDSIPKTSPVQFDESSHIISPYALGVLLGDGCISGGRTAFSTSEQYIVDRMKEEISKIGEFTITKNKHNYTYIIGRVGCGNNKITEELNRLKVNVTSRLKFIPREYLFDSVENRIKLLNGIFDTDGCVRNQRATISTMSKYLKDDIVWLCQSLGIIATVSEDKRDKYKNNGICYIISLNFSNTNIIPFTSPKHLNKYKVVKRKNDAKRIIKNVIKTGRFEEMTCIQISNKSKLFLIDGFVATHNTTVVCNMIKGFMSMGEKVGVWSGELNNPMLKTWLYSVIAGENAIDKTPNPFRTNDFITTVKPEYEKLIDKAVDGKLYVYDGNKNNGFEMLKHFERLHKRFGVKYFFVDNLSILDMSVRGIGKYEGEEEFSKAVASFTRNNRVHLFLIMHPVKSNLNTDPNFADKNGKVKKPEYYDQYSVKGSSAIVNLSHNILFLNKALDHHKAWFIQKITNQLQNRKPQPASPQEIDKMVRLIKSEFSLLGYMVKNRNSGYVYEDALFGYSHETRRIYGLTSKEEDLSKEILDRGGQEVVDEFVEIDDDF